MLRTLIYLTPVVLVALATPVSADTVYLKNGSAIDGTVLGTHEGVVILRIGNVGRIELPENEIENIEKNDRTGYVDPGRRKKSKRERIRGKEAKDDDSRD